MPLRIDHANLIVRDVDATIRFLCIALPDFRLRGEGRDGRGRRWVHVGSDTAYLALHEAGREAAEPFEPYGETPGLNHVGFEVDDAEAVRTRLRAAGYRDSTVPNAHPHRRRVYFRDAEDHDWEFVEYHSKDPAERHDYTLSDLP